MSYLRVIELLETIQIFERKINLALMYSGLRLPQFRAMLFLRKLGKITVSDLSRHLNVTRATVSALINELNKAGIVESVANTADKRSFYIRLTDSGLRRLELASREVALMEENLTREFDKEIIAALNAFSHTINRDK